MPTNRVLLVCVLAGCVAEPPARVARPIVNGERDTGDRAVVALMAYGGTFCTGTLVSPHVVLTAAHCVDPAITNVPYEDMEVFFGTDAGETGEYYPVAGGRMHPGWSVDNPYLHDIAMLELAAAATEQPAALMRRGFDDTFLGRDVRLVGFGVINAAGEGAGEKRTTKSTIIDFNALDFTYGMSEGQTCYGDSGGPGFLWNDEGVEVVAGVTSWGDELCAAFGVDTRVDAYLEEFIQPFIDEVEGTPGRCQADGDCDPGCDPPDPDCGPTGETPFGQPCDADRECMTGLCIHALDDPAFRYCSRACDGDGDCPAGIRAIATTCVDTTDPELSVCAYPIPSPGVVGASCSTHDECWEGRCQTWGTGAICTRACAAAGGGQCPLGSSCQEFPSGESVELLCLPAPQAEGLCQAAPGAPRGAPVALALFLILAGAVRILRGHGKAHRHPHRRR